MNFKDPETTRAQLPLAVPVFCNPIYIVKSLTLESMHYLTNSVLLDRYSRIVYIYIYQIHDHIANSEFSRVFVLDALL